MSFILTHGKFGESEIRLVRLIRKGDRQELRDLAVQLMLAGDFERGFTAGESLPLESKQAIADRVYALAREYCHDQVEPFALVLSEHVLKFFPQVTEVDVEISERLWERVSVGGHAHDRAFRASGEQRLTRVARTAMTVAVESGFTGLPVLKIEPAADGAIVLSGTLTARWRYGWADVPFGLHWQGVRAGALESFASYNGSSVQHLLHSMAQAALEQTPAIAEMQFTLNVTRHHPADLSASGMDDDPDLLIPEDRPLGVVEATVLRQTP